MYIENLSNLNQVINISDVNCISTSQKMRCVKYLCNSKIAKDKAFEEKSLQFQYKILSNTKQILTYTD